MQNHQLIDLQTTAFRIRADTKILADLYIELGQQLDDTSYEERTALAKEISKLLVRLLRAEENYSK